VRNRAERSLTKRKNDRVLSKEKLKNSSLSEKERLLTKNAPLRKKIISPPGKRTYFRGEEGKAKFSKEEIVKCLPRE